MIPNGIVNTTRRYFQKHPMDQKVPFPSTPLEGDAKAAKYPAVYIHAPILAIHRSDSVYQSQHVDP